jgi:hypothetical protein
MTGAQAPALAAPVTPATMRAQADELTYKALSIEVSADLAALRPGLVGEAAAARSEADQAEDRYRLAEGIARALRDELAIVGRRLDDAQADAEAGDIDTRLDAQVELPALKAEAARITARLAGASDQAGALYRELGAASAAAADQDAGLAELDRAIRAPFTSALRWQSAAWSAEFRNRLWWLSFCMVQSGADVDRREASEARAIFDRAVRQSGVADAYKRIGAEEARHGPLVPAYVETSQATADAMTASLRGQLTDTSTQHRGGSIADYSPGRPRGGAT